MFDLITKTRGEDERPKKTRWGWGARMGGSARKTMLFVGSLALIVVPSCWAGLVNLHCCCSTQLQCLEQASLRSALLPWPHHTSTGSGWWGRLAWWVFAQRTTIWARFAFVLKRFVELGHQSNLLPESTKLLVFCCTSVPRDLVTRSELLKMLVAYLKTISTGSAWSRHTLNFNQCAKLSRSLSIVRNIRINFF